MSGKSLKDEVKKRKEASNDDAPIRTKLSAAEKMVKYEQKLADERKLTVIKRHLKEQGFTVDDLYDSVLKHGIKKRDKTPPLPSNREIDKMREEEQKEMEYYEDHLNHTAEPPESVKKELARQPAPAPVPESKPAKPVEFKPPKSKAEMAESRIVINPWGGNNSLF